MADLKISELTLGTPEETDIIPYVDLANNVTKKAPKSTLKGLKGDSATVNAGSTTTIAAGQSATVTNVGTETNAVFDFAIPQGVQGNPGTDGIYAASVSFVGNDMVFVMSDDSTVTLTGAKTDLKGLKGDDGAKIVLAEFDGDDLVFTLNDESTVTLTGAVTALKGIKGDKGDKGDTGATGPAGAGTGDFLADGSVPMTNTLTIETPINELLYAKRTSVFDLVTYNIVATGWTDITSEAGKTKGTASGDVLDVVGDFLYMGKSDQFNSIYIDIATAATSTAARSFEYSTGEGTWATLEVTDGTTNLTTDGVISFTPPVDWAKTTINGSPAYYAVRIGTVSGTFAVEPTVYQIVPGDGSKVAEIYANGNDTTPIFSIDAQGNISLGCTNGSLSLLSSLSGSSSIAGSSGAFSSTVTQTTSAPSQTHVGGFIGAAGSATAITPSQNSPVNRFSAQAWNGFATKTNAMDIYVNPDSEAITSARLAFKNTTINGVADSSELMNLDADGKLNLLGMAQPKDSVFDSVQHYIASAGYVDDTTIAQTLGSNTVDVLNVVGDFLYIGNRDTFESIYFDFETIMSAGTNRTWEYWNGSAWTALTVTDGTNQWQNDGTVTFTAPGPWAKTTVNSVGPLYWVRVGTASGTFVIEPTLRYCLPAPINETLSNGEFEGTTGWETTGDWAYSTHDYTFTFASGVGTLKQPAASFAQAAKANTWYRFRYVIGVAAPASSVLWIGDEFADGNTYFTGSTTEVDVFFKTNSAPGDFVIHVSSPSSGLRIDAVSLVELTGGDFYATGNITGKNLAGINTGNETAASIATIVTGTTPQTTPLDADEFPFYKIVGTVLSKVTWANIKATLKAYFDTLYSVAGLTKYSNLNAPEGFLINGKIVPSVASGHLTVAIKGMDGNDPSATNPVYVRIDGTIRSITAALSWTESAGYNRMNAGSAELATKEIDYFVYLSYVASQGVKVAFARIPNATVCGDFSNTYSNEKWGAFTFGISADFTATTPVVNIGRFAATLSAGAGYTWSVPTFTASNLIQRPIYETRWLTYEPAITWTAGTAPSGSPSGSFLYKIVGSTLHLSINKYGYTAGATVTKATLNAPFTTSILGSVVVFSGGITATNTPNLCKCLIYVNGLEVDATSVSGNAISVVGEYPI